MILETVVIVLVVICLLLMAFLIPVLLQLRLAARNINTAVDTINKRLPVIMENVENLTGDLNKTVSNLNSGIEEVSARIERGWPLVGVLGYLAPMLTGRMTGNFSGKLGTVMAFIKGMKVFFAVLRAGEKPEDPTGDVRDASAGLTSVPGLSEKKSDGNVRPQR